MSLAGKVVLVTGGGAGLGRAFVEGFATDEAVALAADVNPEHLASLGPSVTTVQADIASDDGVERMVSTVLDQHGRIDVLINNAGIIDEHPFLDGPFADWKRIIDVNLLGTARCAYAVLPLMIEQGYGRMINVVTRAAEATGTANSGYAASKAGLVLLNRTLSVIAADSGKDVLVNGLIPGPTDTHMTADWEGERRNELQPPEAVYPLMRKLADLPAGGPNGGVFSAAPPWNGQPYPIFRSFTETLEREAEEWA